MPSSTTKKLARDLGLEDLHYNMQVIARDGITVVGQAIRFARFPRSGLVAIAFAGYGESEVEWTVEPASEVIINRVTEVSVVQALHDLSTPKES